MRNASHQDRPHVAGFKPQQQSCLHKDEVYS